MQDIATGRSVQVVGRPAIDVGNILGGGAVHFQCALPFPVDDGPGIPHPPDNLRPIGPDAGQDLACGVGPEDHPAPVGP